MKATVLFKEFFNSEKAGGLVLLGCTILSLIVANSFFGPQYHHFWQTQFSGHSIEYWINDGLMTIFFLLVGLELEREIYKGELSDIKDALLPIFGALGGMLVPAGLFLLLNFGKATQPGAGIPMATDIAFALGILSLLGNRVPVSLKIFLTAFAVIDDLGAILVIAVFYTKTILWTNLLIASGIFVLLVIINRLKIRNLIPYLLGGIAMWYFMLHSGIHPTITGVLLAFAIPFGTRRLKITILQASALFAQTGCLYHFTSVCFGQYFHNFKPGYWTHAHAELQPGNCPGTDCGETPGHFYAYFSGRVTRTL